MNAIGLLTFIALIASPFILREVIKRKAYRELISQLKKENIGNFEILGFTSLNTDSHPKDILKRIELPFSSGLLFPWYSIYRVETKGKEKFRWFCLILWPFTKNRIQEIPI